MKSGVITAKRIEDQLWKNYREGLEMGQTSHFPKLDDHFRWVKHEVILLAGIGNFGKSAIMHQLLMNKIVKDGWRVALFSPEQSPPEYFFSDLIHMWSGKSTQKQYSNYMEEHEYAEALKWVDDKFFYIYPEDDAPTPEYINSRFELIMKKYHLDAVVVDPFAALVADRKKNEGREDLYIEWYVQHNRRFAQKHNCNYVIVTHPNSTVEREKDGNFKCMDAFHIKGGPAWNSMVDVLMVFHRPYFVTSPKNTICILKTLKIKKQRVGGIPGSVIFTFDRKTNRFYELGDEVDTPIESVNPMGGFNPLDEVDMNF